MTPSVPQGVFLTRQRNSTVSSMCLIISNNVVMATRQKRLGSVTWVRARAVEYTHDAVSYLRQKYSAHNYVRECDVLRSSIKIS